MRVVTALGSLAGARAILAAVTTQPRGTPAALIAGSVVLALTIAACSTSTSPATSTGRPTAGATDAPSAGATAIPTQDPSPEPSSTETGPPAAPCTAADVKVSHGLVEGTAGARETEVVLVAAAACAVRVGPVFSIRDAGGARLVEGAPSGGGWLLVQPGGSYASNVQFANWCDDDPDAPLSLELHLETDSIAVTDGPFPEVGDMPPCTASDPPTLIATAWAPSS